MRRKTRKIKAGSLFIGGDAPISVQSMANTDTRDVSATLSQIRQLATAGCELVRVAVPDYDAALKLAQICTFSPIPVVADIHFDYRLALIAAESGISKIRINPGNIGSKQRLLDVSAACKERSIPIRVGVNGGSLQQSLISKHGMVSAMVESALIQLDELEKTGMENVCLSLKSSSVTDTIMAYRIISSKTDAPLHIGVTEAGISYHGIIKSAIGIGSLLCDGIGDTIRVSLTEQPVEEVSAGIAILKACGLRKTGVNLISCPTCGRCRCDVIATAKEIQKALENETRPITIAVMGCAVNGPGEARHADIGVAGGDNCGLIFRRGEIIKKVASHSLSVELLKEVNLFFENNI